MNKFKSGDVVVLAKEGYESTDKGHFDSIKAGVGARFIVLTGPDKYNVISACPENNKTINALYYTRYFRKPSRRTIIIRA